MIFCGKIPKFGGFLLMKRLILALILLVVVLITGCADAGRRDQDKKSVHGPTVTLGIERIGEYEQLFAGKRVGLITNQTGVDSKLRSSEDILLAHTDLIGIFVPEHGLFGAVAAGDDVDGAEYKGVKVYSLYGAARRPTPAMLDAIDVMTVDIQDVGARHYTYVSTMAYAMEECAKAGKVCCFRPSQPDWGIDGGAAAASRTGKLYRPLSGASASWTDYRGICQIYQRYAEAWP